MFKKIGLYYRTIKHLKPIQLRYRLWYIFRSLLRKLTAHFYPLTIPKEGTHLELKPSIPKPSTLDFRPSTSKISFTFLNQTHSFEGKISWNFSRYGKLWAYNLNYFDYLHQRNVKKEDRLKLIREFIDQIDTNHEGLEPYPISLRGINWIKFLSKCEVENKEIDASLYAQYQILLDNIEYHIMGNHLLENGCSLLFGAYYFQDDELYEKAKEILFEELDEQILEDGGHFERSTMYHCILLERLLDCYNVVKGSDWMRGDGLKRKLRKKIELMLGWLKQLTVNSDQLSVELPLLNDGAKDIAPEPLALFGYAGQLGLQMKPVNLGESGYCRYSADSFELICDVGNIGPDYQPGHAHSDTFSFVLYAGGKPLIIDPGISTYENNDRRQLERSTEFHNTVRFEDKEQSEVWSAFRVGRRARVNVKDKAEKNLVASHDGYQPWGIIHGRKWLIQEDHIYIEDRLVGKGEAFGTSYLHFHPDLLGKISVEGNRIQTDEVRIEFEGGKSIKKYVYDCPDGYNQYIKAPKIEVPFVNKLITKIYWNAESTA